MKMLITGASGFIGGSLFKKFVNNADIAVYAYNRSNPSEFDGIDFDVIVHCAANSVIRDGGTSVWDSNVTLTHELLERFTRRNIKKPFFINLSSVAVYGRYIYPPTEVSRCNPLSVYGMSKLASEFLVKKYTTEGKIYAATLRLGGVCGPKMTHGIIKKIIQHYQEDKQSINFIHPAPGNHMSYIHVDTVTEFISRLISVRDVIKHQTIPHTYNVVADDTMNITEIVDLFNYTLNKNMKITWIDQPGFINDGSIFIANNMSLSGYIPAHSTRVNLERTIKECLQ